MPKSKLVTDEQPDPPDWRATLGALDDEQPDPLDRDEFSASEYASQRQGMTWAQANEWLERAARAGRVTKRLAKLRNGRAGNAYRVVTK